MRRRSGTTVGAVAVLLLTACGSGDAAGGAGRETQPVALTVFAASSLTSSFEELGQRFEATHPGVTVELSFAGSSDLVSQIQQGAPADVFAAADAATMARLTTEGLDGSDPVDFATNRLRIAVPPDNPAEVGSLQDLAGDLSLVVCAPEVPCGSAARTVAESAGVQLEPVSEEQSVTDVLNKVTTGEADAGLVYVTDIVAAGDAVQGVELPEADAAVNVYSIATVADSDQADLAQEFVELVAGDDGQAVLEAAGFGAP